MSADIQYRPGTPEDGASLLRIHQRAILEIAVRDYGDAIARSWAHGLSAAGYGRSMAEGETFDLAVVQGTPVAFCGIKGDEVCGLYVEPGAMRRGIGSTLLNRAIERHRLSVFPVSRLVASLTALPFYQRQGFRIVAETCRPTRGGLVMRVVAMERPLTEGQDRV